MTFDQRKWNYEAGHANHLKMALMVEWLLSNTDKDWAAFVNAFPNLPFDAYERTVATADRFRETGG